MSHSKKIVFKALLPTLLIIAIGAWATLYKINNDARMEAANSMDAVISTTQQAVHSWFNENRSDALLWANTELLRKLSAELIRTQQTKSALLSSPAQTKLRTWFAPISVSKDYMGFFIVGPGNINLASSRDSNIAEANLLIQQPEFINKIWAGNTVISLPQISDVPLRDQSGNLVRAMPTMFVGAPIKNSSGEIISLLLFRINPSLDFTKIFLSGQIGQSGEVYAINRSGRLISESRFDKTLHEIGLIPADKDSILNIEIRDPLLDLTRGKKAETPRNLQPFTYMAKSLMTGKSGRNLKGYRDYRGVPVMGVWRWDHELGFGFAYELDIKEFNQSQFTVKVAFLFFVSLAMIMLTLLTLLFENSRRKLDKEIEKVRISSQCKSDFLSRMSHELRTPMNAILGFGQLLEMNSNQLNESQKDHVKEILDAGNHLLSLINEVLDLSKIESGKLEVHMTSISINEVLEQCLSLIQPLLKERHLELSNNISTRDYTVLADPIRLKQVLLNLLSNAVKYNSEHGHISLNITKLSEHRIRISVTDTGKGLTQDEMTKLFTPFERLDAKCNIEGAGIGLVISKHLVELMGGTVGADSTQGEGSTFWFELDLYLDSDITK